MSEFENSLPKEFAGLSTLICIPEEKERSFSSREWRIEILMASQGLSPSQAPITGLGFGLRKPTVLSGKRGVKDIRVRVPGGGVELVVVLRITLTEYVGLRERGRRSGGTALSGLRTCKECIGEADSRSRIRQGCTRDKQISQISKLEGRAIAWEATTREEDALRARSWGYCLGGNDARGGSVVWTSGRRIHRGASSLRCNLYTDIRITERHGKWRGVRTFRRGITRGGHENGSLRVCHRLRAQLELEVKEEWRRRMRRIQSRARRMKKIKRVKAASWMRRNERVGFGGHKGRRAATRSNFQIEGSCAFWTGNDIRRGSRADGKELKADSSRSIDEHSPMSMGWNPHRGRSWQRRRAGATRPTWNDTRRTRSDRLRTRVIPTFAFELEVACAEEGLESK
ncbi:hypothetical protein C8R45DRAFT_1070411 [Mycena sanguinolenta]|nr:hypothetical protein C8R45DRAFT_1070411 [Mycena sanguinolenta]